MNRPGAARQDDYQGGNDPEVAGYMQFVPFVPPMGAMESQAHASASYTANWVSSTSSIPPEMKDEPESDNISQYDSQRPPSHLNGDWTDHEDYMSPSTMQQSFTVPPPSRPMPYVEKDKSTSQSTTKTSKSAKGEKSDEKRELTFDERLEKARMQKSRAENKGTNGESSSNLPIQHHAPATSPSTRSYQKTVPSDYPKTYPTYYNNNSSRGGYFKEQFKPRDQNNPREQYRGQQQQQQRQPQQPPQQYFQHPQNNAVQERDRTKRDNYSANRYDNNTHNNTNQPRNIQDNNRPSNYRGRGGAPRGGSRGGFQAYPPLPFPYGHRPNNMPDLGMMPNITNNLQNTHISKLPPGMAPGVPLVPFPYGPPFHRQPIQQDVKFHNTWLDASNCPMSLAAMVAVDTRFGRGGFAPTTSYRGRGGRGGGYVNRGGYRGGYSSPRYTARPAEPVVANVSEKAPETKLESLPKAEENEKPEDQEDQVEKKEEKEPEVESKPGEKVELKTEDKENGKPDEKDDVEKEKETKEESKEKTPDVIPEVVISEPTESANTDNEVKIVEKKVEDEKEAESS